VPVGHRYHVRLHFAEVFDDSAGQRLENIAINGRPVLQHFDIFTAAGGFAKAVVRDFDQIAPDDHGNIVIEVQATPTSKDQNAKISGLEILEETGT
jgi:hypothetical protein